MIQYNNVNIKLSDSQLDKLKSAKRNATEEVLSFVEGHNPVFSLTLSCQAPLLKIKPRLPPSSKIFLKVCLPKPFF